MNVSIHTHEFNKNPMTVKVSTQTPWNCYLSIEHRAIPKGVDETYIYNVPDEFTAHISSLTIEEAEDFIQQLSDACSALDEWNAQRKADVNEDVNS